MNDSGELLIKFVIGGRPIVGASHSLLNAPGKVANPLTRGFEPGFMIDIASFNFRCGVAGSESAAADGPPPRGAPGRKADSAEDASAHKARHSSVVRPAGSAAFQSWRSGKAIKYPLDVQPITFDRLIDVSSTQLIQNCIDCISYDSATLIKRKPAGGPLAGEVYLRIDFGGVLVTAVEWSDGDYVTERCTFICRSVTVSYRSQLPQGGLGPVVSGFWSMVPHERQEQYT